MMLNEKFLEELSDEIRLGNHDDELSDPEYRHVLKIVVCFLGVVLVFVILGVLAITRG